MSGRDADTKKARLGWRNLKTHPPDQSPSAAFGSRESARNRIEFRLPKPGEGSSWMKETCRRWLRLTSTGLLLVSLLSDPAWADIGDRAKPGQAFEIAAFEPIGKIFSLGNVTIDGRLASGEHPIWGGELLRVADGASASCVLDSIGRVVLGRGSTARLNRTSSNSDEDTVPAVLIISLTMGDLSVNLEGRGSAYLEVCGSAFQAGEGASFRCGIRQGRVVLNVTKGSVIPSPQVTRRTYVVRLVKPTLSTSHPNIEVKSNDSTTLVAGVTQKEQKDPAATKRQVSFTPGFRQTVVPPPESPAPGKRVQFTLSKNIGELRPSITTTEADGTALITFKAGRNLDDADITATVIDLIHTDTLHEEVQEWTGHIVVVKGAFWTRRKKTVAVAAAIAGIIVGVTKRKGPLRQNPPAEIP